MSHPNSMLTMLDVEYRERTSHQYRDRTSLFKDKTLVVTGRRHFLSWERVYLQCLSDIETQRNIWKKRSNN